VLDESWSSCPLAYKFACVAAQMLQDAQPLPLMRVRDALHAEVVSRYGGCDRRSLKRLAMDLMDAFGHGYLVRGKGPQELAVRRWLGELLVEKTPSSFIERYVVLAAYLFGSLGNLRQAEEGVGEVSKMGQRFTENEGDTNVRMGESPADFPPLCALPKPAPSRLSSSMALLCATLVATKLTPRQRRNIPVLQQLYAEGAPMMEIMKITSVRNLAIVNVLGSAGDGRRARRLAKFYERRNKYRANAGGAITRAKYFQNGEIRWLREHDGEWLFNFLQDNDAAMREAKSRRSKPRRGRDENDFAKDVEWSQRMQLEVEALKDAQTIYCKRVTPGYVMRRIPLKNVQELLGVGARLPMTREVLLAACESEKAYLFRRFVWFLVRLWRPGERIPRVQLRRHCLLSRGEMSQFLWLAGLEHRS